MMVSAFSGVFSRNISFALPALLLSGIELVGYVADLDRARRCSGAAAAVRGGGREMPQHRRHAHFNAASARGKEKR